MKTPVRDEPRSAPPAETGRTTSIGRRGRLPFGRKGIAFLMTWAVMLAVWIQFALASLDELEPQAAWLGAIVVVILFVGGALVWLATHQTNSDR